MSSEDKSPKNPFEGFRVQIDPEKIEETLAGIRDRASAAFKDGRYTKVRLSYNCLLYTSPSPRD